MKREPLAPLRIAEEWLDSFHGPTTLRMSWRVFNVLADKDNSAGLEYINGVAKKPERGILHQRILSEISGSTYLSQPVKGVCVKWLWAEPYYTSDGDRYVSDMTVAIKADEARWKQPGSDEDYRVSREWWQLGRRRISIEVAVSESQDDVSAKCLRAVKEDYGFTGALAVNVDEENRDGISAPPYQRPPSITRADIEEAVASMITSSERRGPFIHVDTEGKWGYPDGQWVWLNRLNSETEAYAVFTKDTDTPTWISLSSNCLCAEWNLPDIEPDLVLDDKDKHTKIGIDLSGVSQRIRHAAAQWAQHRFEKWALGSRPWPDEA